MSPYCLEDAPYCLEDVVVAQLSATYEDGPSKRVKNMKDNVPSAACMQCTFVHIACTDVIC